MKHAILPALLCVLFMGAACSPQYDAVETGSPLALSSEREQYAVLPDPKTFDFDRKIPLKGNTFYYESGERENAVFRTVESAAEALAAVEPLIEPPADVYLTSRAVTHCTDEGLWVGLGDGAPLIAACLLAEADGEELPFGVYAGVGMTLLNESPALTGQRLEAELRKFPHCRELQYPLFSGADGTESKTAWSFAYRVASDWLDTHSADELLSAADGWEETFDRCGATIPDYRFLVGDGCYGTRAETKRLRMFFAADYVDRFFEEEDFSLAYPVLTDFIERSERYAEETIGLLGAEDFPEPLVCYMGGMSGWEFLWDGGFSGYFEYRDDFPFIVCNGVYAFAHEATHYILWYMGQNYINPLNEAICSYFAYRSEDSSEYSVPQWKEYNQTACYDKFYKRGEPQDEETRRQWLESVEKAKTLYHRAYGVPDAASFSALKWLACNAVLEHATVEDMLPATDEYSTLKILFVQYLYETYGAKTLLDVDRTWKNAVVGDKRFDDLTADWLEWLYAPFA